MKIGIVNYNMGNLASVQNGFKKIGIDATIESDAQKLKNYDKLILPGVGAFGDAIEHLKQFDLIEALEEFKKSGRYMLGICLGMQLLMEKSYEFGENKGLGFIKGEVIPFDTNKFDKPLKVPHMGWNRVFTKEHPLFDGLDDMHYLYFVHSYHVKLQNKDNEIGSTVYGYSFSSAIAHENVLGIQPHPEKSHNNGLKILENFSKL